MRRRLDLGASLVGRPPVILLDEPTTGLNPRSRQELWRVVDELRRAGTTVLLTTQYLEEADRVAQRIAVVDRGRAVAEGTAAQLKATVAGDMLAVRIADPGRVATAATVLADLASDRQPRIDADAVRLAVTNPGASAEALRRLGPHAVPVAAIELQQPSLDDVFLALTGRRAEDRCAHPRMSRRPHEHRRPHRVGAAPPDVRGDPRRQPDDALAFLHVLAFAYAYAFSWISAFVGLSVRDPETAQSAGFIWVFPLVFASSAFVPTSSMPGVVRAFADVNTVTLVVEAVPRVDDRPGDALAPALERGVGGRATTRLRAARRPGVPARRGAVGPRPPSAAGA
jgi:hypothetical protein